MPISSVGLFSSPYLDMPELPAEMPSRFNFGLSEEFPLSRQAPALPRLDFNLPGAPEPLSRSLDFNIGPYKSSLPSYSLLSSPRLVSYRQPTVSQPYSEFATGLGQVVAGLVPVAILGGLPGLVAGGPTIAVGLGHIGNAAYNAWTSRHSDGLIADASQWFGASKPMANDIQDYTNLSAFALPFVGPYLAGNTAKFLLKFVL